MIHQPNLMQWQMCNGKWNRELQHQINEKQVIQDFSK